MNELVSIVIPVYNAERVIEATIDSVLSQSYPYWELILVNDGSTDESASVIRKLPEKGKGRIRLIDNKGEHGASYARNLGITEAEGRFLCFLDADDLWDSDKLSKQLRFMEEKKASFSFTGYEFADENGIGTGKTVKVPSRITYEEALKNTTIFTSTVMFDLSVLKREEILMPNIESEDTACWWKILRSGVTAFGLDESLTLYRRSLGTLSSNKTKAVRRIWRLYREAEGLSVLKSAYCFCFWAVRAVLRRI